MIILLAINILSIFICFFIAKFRHAQAYYWAFCGAILGPLALPFVFFSKPVTDKNK